MNILIIDDEMNICLTLHDILGDEGYNCDYADNGRLGLEKVEQNLPDIVLLDVLMNDINGLDVLEKIKEIDKNIQVVMISGHSGIREAVTAMKKGAFDFLEKPLSLPKIKITVKKAMDFISLQNDYTLLKQDYDSKYRIIGESKAIRDLKIIISKVARSNSKVLIRGESGTGKELIAYAIHQLSERANKSFIKFNSAAIPNDLVESELFGFEKGSFTGAVKSKKGKLEQADGGTLFLDEIGDMSLSAQAKILRVIQEGEFERVGSNKTEKINARIIAATHKNLEEKVKEGSFREDLYFRLNVVPVISPPLRDRSEDIPVLLNYFSNLYSAEMKIHPKTFQKEVLQELKTWNFPGNVRELRNLTERIYILIEKQVIELDDLKKISNFTEQLNSLQSTDINGFWYDTKPFIEKKREFETKYLQKQLEIHSNNISKTAKVLGLQQSNLSRKLKDLKINTEE